MNCKDCKFWNKKKVISPAKHGFCECIENRDKFQMVLPGNETCKYHKQKRTAKSADLKH